MAQDDEFEPFERPDRIARRTMAARGRYMMRNTSLQHRPASSQVNPYDRVFGTHTHFEPHKQGLRDVSTYVGKVHAEQDDQCSR